MEEEKMSNGSDQQEHTDTASTEETGGWKRVPRIERWTETLTAVMLGIVAIATAWSGYQSARRGGVQAGKQT